MGGWLGMCVRYSNLYYSYLACMISIYRKLKTCVGACVYMRRMQGVHYARVFLKVFFWRKSKAILVIKSMMPFVFALAFNV